MGDFDSLFAALDPDERRRGHEFEVVCRWFLENDPTYASRMRRVWLWREWPGRWREDGSGIDLVAEDTNGKLWAVQAKAYRADKPIPRRELTSFLSDSSRKEFSYRLLISTTNVLHPTAQETVAAQEKPVMIVYRSDLRAAPVDWPATFGDLRASAGATDVEQQRLPRNPALLSTTTEELVEALRVRDEGDPRFEEWFGLLERYVSEFGHARPAGNCRFDGRNLGVWVIQQRQLWSKGKLSPPRVERLQRLPGWTFSVHESAWLDNYHQLARFVAAHGSPSVPVDFEAENGLCLAAWIVTQRTRHAAGKLAPHRVRLLEAVPGWTWHRSGASNVAAARSRAAR